MKKILIIGVCVALFACNKNGKDGQNQTNGTTILWAETAESNLPMVQDTMWSKEQWDKAYKMDKPAIFHSIKNAVISGKLKAYTWYPDGAMTPKEFEAILSSWDSTATVEDANNPGTIITAPVKTDVTPEDMIEMRFDEKIEFDTVSFSVNKKVSVIQFIGYKIHPVTHEVMGKKKLFDVKLPDGTNAEAKK